MLPETAHRAGIVLTRHKNCIPAVHAPASQQF